MSASVRHDQGGVPTLVYDFQRCKLCGQRSAEPRYRLAKSTVYRCTACDFHAIDFLDPPPAPASASGGDLDQRALAYIDERVQSPDPLLSLRLALLQKFAPLPAARCLDIGAGVGQFLRRLAEVGASPCGLEPSRMRCEYARRRFGLELVPETVEQFCLRPQAASSFDIVTLWDVIEHVNFPAETLAAAHRILKPGGWLFIDTPSRDVVPYRLSQAIYRLSGGRSTLFLETFYPLVPYGHKQIFRPQQLVRLVQQVGFEIVRMENGYGRDSGLFSFLRPRDRIVLIARRPLPTQGRDVAERQSP